MSKKKVSIIYPICFLFLIAFSLWVIGVLAGAFFMEQGIIPMDTVCIFPCGIAIWTAFGTTLAGRSVAKTSVLFQVLLAEVLLMSVLLLIGLAFQASELNWMVFGLCILISAAATIATLLLFGGIKKKNFKKNAGIRLKKR